MTNKKQKAMAGAVGVAGIVFLAHAISILTGWYDMTPMYEFFNVDAGEFGWTAFSAPAAYLVTKIGYDVLKSNSTYKAELDKFNTDRLVAAQTLVNESSFQTNLKLDRQYSIQKENNELMKQIIQLEAEKKARLDEIEARKQALIEKV